MTVNVATLAVGLSFGVLLGTHVATASSLTIIQKFGERKSDGQRPNGLTLVGDKLYGTTQSGGSAGGGTVFSIDLKTNVERTIHAFAGGMDGFQPNATVIEMNGALYGTTYFGGSSNGGTAYRIELATGVTTILHSFTGNMAGSTDGTALTEPLINVGGMLYGTAGGGGMARNGVIFTIDPTTSAETIVHYFTGYTVGSDGSHPISSLLYLGGKLYGTTLDGGYTTGGTVFSFDPATEIENPIYSFPYNNGHLVGPGTMLLGSGNKVYGTTDSDGANGSGTIFVVDTSFVGIGSVSVLYNFKIRDHFYVNQLSTSLDGLFYGTTSEGMLAGFGRIFSINPITGVEKDIYTFTFGYDGENPGPLVAVNGQLYGTASFSVNTAYQRPGYGTAFKLNKP